MENDKVSLLQKQKITMGGGCFWCTEAIFQQLKGVSKVESGYSGGHIKNPCYREVTSGSTGHTEVIEITYDPSIISFKELAIIHLSTHNPTTLNRQGADVGTQYRSAIFYRDEAEKSAATAAISEVQPAYTNPIVTEVTQFEAFYLAEIYHQDYYNNNKTKPYCMAVINPKLAKFRSLYANKMNNA